MKKKTLTFICLSALMAINAFAFASAFDGKGNTVEISSEASLCYQTMGYCYIKGVGYRLDFKCDSNKTSQLCERWLCKDCDANSSVIQ